MYHPLGDVGLDSKDVVERLVIDLGPQMGAIGSIHELWRDPQASGPLWRLLPADRSFDHIIDAQLGADLLEGLLRILVGVGTRTADHAQALDRRQPRGNLFGDPVGEVLLLGGAEV